MSRAALFRLASFMPEWPSPDDWLLRADALASIGVAMSAGEAEAASQLLDYAIGCPSLDWRCQRRYEVYRASPANSAAKRSRAPITRMPSPSEIDDAIRTRFWRMARYQKHAWADGNRATYIGPVFLALTHIEVRQKGRSPPLVGDNALAVGVARDWRIRIYLHAIAFRAAPLIADLRNAGGRIDAAVAFLKSRQRLPASAPVPDSPAKRPATLETEYEKDLRERPPRGEGKAQRARQMAERHGWNAGTIANWLARPEGDALWRSLGGRPAPAKRSGQ